MNFTDEEINKIINSHVKSKEYRRNYYRNKYQTDPIHRELQLKRSKDYYHNHKKKNEIKTGVYHLAKKRYDYFKKNNNIQKFIDKYPEDYEMWFSKEVVQSNINLYPINN